MIENRRFERMTKKITLETYMKHKDPPGNKETFVYGFKQIETEKIDKYILIGCESDELYGNYKLFNFWSIKFKID